MKNNIILITVDSLRQDHMSCYGYKKKTTPFLDKTIKKNSLKFDDTFSTGPFTPMSFPGIISATYPLEKDYYLPLPNKEKSISMVLKSNGYKTAAFISSNGFLSKYYGYNSGFDFFQDYIKVQKTKRMSLLKRTIINLFGPESKISRFIFKANYFDSLRSILKGNKKKVSQNANKIFTDAIEWVKQNSDTPFFLWLHLMDTHTPYFLPKEFKKQHHINISDRKEVILSKIRYLSKTKMVLNKLIELYDYNISYVDEQLNIFMNKLDSLSKLEDTSIIMTSDHGDAFGEHGRLGHGPQMYDELLRVPLIIINTNIKKHETKGVFSLIQIPSTILDLANIKHHSYNKKSLLDQAGGAYENIIAECALDRYTEHYDEIGDDRIICCRTSDYKYILHMKTKAEEFYDLINDPEERTNMIGNPNKDISKLKNIISEHLKRSKKIKSDLKEDIQEVINNNGIKL